MKRQRMRALLPHLLIVLSLFLSTFWVLDQLNPQMGFMSNAIATTVEMLYFLLVLFSGVREVIGQCVKSVTAKEQP